MVRVRQEGEKGGTDGAIVAAEEKESRSKHDIMAKKGQNSERGEDKLPLREKK